jgi:hypothetical protein
MITGTHIKTALFITPPVYPPQTPDFVEREIERESLSAGEAEACPPERRKRNWRQGDKKNGRRGEGRGASCKIHITLSKYFAHPFRLKRPMQMLCLPVKDVPP